MPFFSTGWLSVRLSWRSNSLQARSRKRALRRSTATDLSFAQDRLNQAMSQEVQARFAIFAAQLR
ncbi:hypothetical protein, partial [Ralstonia pseudosolanacearum]|uniref:hypothetical protein n=1 Tax=Ralstonia pseudosolanacearum TaxID=1310165 RepID=UPI003AAFF488